jgi:hypothetical protein
MRFKPQTYRTDPATFSMTRVFVDTNVLFPFSVMDLMLVLTEDGVHEVLWTQALLAEWERVIVRAQRRSAASAAAITAANREYFADSEVPEPACTHLIERMPGKDLDDRVHMAAAIAGRGLWASRGALKTSCGS